MENVNIDQSVLAEDVSSKIKYDFLDMFLVKPLDAVKVKKEFSKPVSDQKPTEDANGIEAVDYDKVETEVKEVDSDYRKGIVLKIPMSYVQQLDDKNININKVNIGDVVIFRDRAGMNFDLLKDSRLIRYYDIVAIER